MKPLISIIVPVYDSVRTFHRCVDSNLNQTFTDVWSQSDIPVNFKYKLSVNEVVTIVAKLFYSYKQLNVCSIEF